MISTILFDFGNVLLELDEQKTMDAFTKILDPKLSTDLNEMAFYPFEKGEISEEAFFNRLQRRSKVVLQGDVYIEAWNSMLGSFPLHRISMLRNYRKKFALGLLSNTNITHLRFVDRKIKEEHGGLDFRSLFDYCFLSHEINLRKPEADVYHYVLSQMNINPENCLFIDDKSENILAANRLGFKTYLHDPHTEIFDLLPQLILSNG
ncbi:MAG TPA: HAD family phosphatase [Saprospiraceae bacterium]|nr:HAD family phosphatase [Saprospiraceae bacterium]